MSTVPKLERPVKFYFTDGSKAEALPEEIVARVVQMQKVCTVVSRELRSLVAQLTEANVRFPSALSTELDHIDLSVEAIRLILLVPHLEA